METCLVMLDKELDAAPENAFEAELPIMSKLAKSYVLKRTELNEVRVLPGRGVNFDSMHMRCVKAAFLFIVYGSQHRLTLRA